MLKPATRAAVVLLLLGSTAAQNPPKNRIPHLTPDQWRQDLHVLATEIARRHKNAFHFTPKTKFEAAVVELDRRIPSLKPFEIMVGMMGVLAMVGDGHTRCDDLFNSFSQFPLDLYWFDGELRVIRTTPQYTHALGGKVVAIGSTPIAIADHRVRTVIERHETEGWVKQFSAFYLVCPEILSYFGIINNIDRAIYTVEKDGKQSRVAVYAIPYNAEPAYLDVASRLPLYRQHTNKVWFTYIPDANLTYLAFNRYPSG